MTDSQARFALAALLCLALAGPAAAADDGCRIERKAQLPLTESFGRFTTPVSINDQTLPMMVDTGAQRAFLSPSAADRLRLPFDPSRTLRPSGIAGPGDARNPRVARSIVFGGTTWPDYPLQTTAVGRPEQAGEPDAPMGLIGADILSAYDVELDFPARTATLYAVSGCSGQFVPWTGHYDLFVTGSAGAVLFVIPVKLDGHWLKALVDTGANTTSMTLAAAHAAGATDEALKADPLNTYFGAQGVAVAGRRHAFRTFSTGGAYRRVQISVLDTSFGAFDMLLGMDFLRTRRMWLSYRTGQLFIQQASPVAE